MAGHRVLVPGIVVRVHAGERTITNQKDHTMNPLTILHDLIVTYTGPQGLGTTIYYLTHKH